MYPKDIAIVGTAPHKTEAPFGDPGWLVCACSPGNENLPDWDVWCELHDEAVYTDGTPQHQQYCEFLKKDRGKPVFVKGEVPWIPNSRPFPFDLLRAHPHFDDEFLSCTPAWMMAWACLLRPRRIGLFGIDMAHESERAKHERSGVRFFMTYAEILGIELVLPKTSKMLISRAPYGFEPEDPAFLEISRKIDILQERKSGVEKQHAECEHTIKVLNGALFTLRETRMTLYGV